MKKVILLWTMVLLTLHGLYAQRCSVAFYNVENLFDTIPSLFYDDSDFTPKGKYRWNTERYNRKITGLARVIDELHADVVGLAEVENEEVVRDLVRALKTDYCYVHFTSGDRRGIDLALLYKGDILMVDQTWLSPSGVGREFLNVRGELFGKSIQFVVCHLPSVYTPKELRERALTYLEKHIANTTKRYPEMTVIALGDMNQTYNRKLQQRLGYEAPLLQYSHKGYGSYKVNGQWRLIDNIFLCNGQDFCVSECGIYIQEYMTHWTNNGRQPYRTFGSQGYRGGISDHLPVYVIMSIREGEL
ncbi:MAG: endonuclease/exonuclease/phosphatase family protein [Rikenellaceae bacterium]|nr:endonuclease/exonuclease/phosphatase family protein [Rikenellaceae bacterium]